MHEVWITGIGIVSACGSGLEEHAAAIRQARTGLSRHSFFNGTPPDPCVAGIIPQSIIPGTCDDSATNRADQILEHALHQAIASAGLKVPFVADMLAGTTLGNMHAGTCYYKELREKKEPAPQLLSGFLSCAPLINVAKKLQISGKKWTVASACGSATAALGHAFGRIRHGQSSMVIAGGFEALSPFVIAGFNSLQLVAKNACRPFSATREGLNPGEGAAMLVLESKESARARNAQPLARITGFGDALDAYHHTAAHPEGQGLAHAITEALSSADIAAGTIDHVHLHGTGTQVNDSSEYFALKSIFAEQLPQIPACSTKSMTGHTFGASGALNAVFACISLRENIIPATLNCDDRDPLFEGLNIQPAPVTTGPLEHVLSTSLGFGGEAFALILSKADTQ